MADQSAHEFTCPAVMTEWEPGDPIYPNPGADWVSTRFGCCGVTVNAETDQCPQCGRLITDEDDVPPVVAREGDEGGKLT